MSAAGSGEDRGSADFAWLELPRSARTAVYVADPGRTGTWYYVSPHIEVLLGFSVEDWCTHPGLWARQLHPEDRERLLRQEPPSRAQTNTMVAEYRLCHREGHAVWVRDDAMVVRSRDGELRWHGILSDITDHKLLEVELERRLAQQSAVARLGEHALEGVPTSDLMQEAAAVAAELLGVEYGAVLELLADQDELVVRAGVGSPPASGTGLRGLRIPAGRGSQAGSTLLAGNPLVVRDWSRETRLTLAAAGRERGLRSAITVPIDGPGGAFGVFSVASRSARAFAHSDVDFVQSLANVLADALERQVIESAVRHRALHDQLTGLPNRSLFEDRLGHALARLRRRDSVAAVLFLDLDRFKLINDSLGHQTGDDLLIETTQRLRAAIRVSDTVARFGGDEFAILLEDISGEQEATEVAQRIVSEFSRPFSLTGGEHVMTTSIGIALATGGELAQDLLRDADTAMYRAKDRGRARYEVFDDAMRSQALARLRIENDLRRALERDELWLAYQPIVSLDDGQMVAVEALLRWNHPVRGAIAPSEFIPVAEEAGMIEPIGRWVLETACRQAAQWHHERPQSPPLQVAVNLSGVQISRRELPEVVARALRATGLEPPCLALEITESAMLRDTGAIAFALPALKRLGVQLVLDDFGSGYSSLGYLVMMPLDALKIDRSFIEGLGINARDTTLTEAIIAMARALSLLVVGEGVERDAQRSKLRRLGCHYAQGYTFSAPVPARKIEAMLDARRPLGHSVRPRRRRPPPPQHGDRGDQ